MQMSLYDDAVLVISSNSHLKHEVALFHLFFVKQSSFYKIPSFSKQAEILSILLFESLSTYPMGKMQIKI